MQPTACMDGGNETSDPRDLETHRPWLRRLAAGILEDADRAEDCVQETFLAALRERSSSAPSSPAWLRRVLVNAALRALRRDALRREREAAAAGERAAIAPHAPPRELQVELLRGVEALGAPYRDVVHLRYAEGLAPRAIARRLKVSTKTVDSWLYRAHGRLRERLDGRFDGFRGWAPLALAWLLAGAARRGRGAVGAGALRAAAACVALALVGAWLVRAAGDPPAVAREVAAAPALRAPAPALPADALAPPRPAEGADARAVAEPASPARPPDVPPAAPPEPERAWRGRVLDERGAPVGGVRVRYAELAAGDLPLFTDRAGAGIEELLQRKDLAFRPELGEDAAEPPPGWADTTDADGAFALVRPDREGWIAVDDRAWATLSTSIVLGSSALADPLVRVAPARRVAGRVTDERGEPLRSARVELRLPERFLEADSSTPTRVANEPCAFTDADGRFALERAPAVADAVLRFRLAGYETAELPLGAGGVAGTGGELAVTLRADEPELVVRGRVTGPDGAPLSGAFVSLDWVATATSDAAGEFRLRPPAGALARGACTLRAAAQGFRSVERALVRAGGAWPRAELELFEPALDITGIVLRPDGTPHAHAAVWVPAPTLLGAPPGDRTPVFAEHVMSGPQDGGSLEATVTDAQGVFRLLGLEDRPYVLRVADLDTREWFETEPIMAGVVGVVLELPPDGTWDVVRGVVVDRRGAPVPGARIARSYPRLDAPLPDGRRWVTRFAGTPVVSGDDGAFVLTDVPRRDGRLVVNGPSILTREVRLVDAPEAPTLTIAVARACRVVVERTAGAPPFDAFSLCASGGRRLDLLPAVRAQASSLERAPLADPAVGARSAEFFAADIAEELLLWSGEELVLRVSVELDAGGPNVLRP